MFHTTPQIFVIPIFSMRHLVWALASRTGSNMWRIKPWSYEGNGIHHCSSCDFRAAFCGGGLDLSMYLKMKELKGKLVLAVWNSHSSCQHSGYATETAQGKKRIGGKVGIGVGLCMDVCKIKRLAFSRQTEWDWVKLEWQLQILQRDFLLCVFPQN